VKYVSMIPLISPVVNGDNMLKVSNALEFDYMYYQKQYNSHGDYPYPFVNYKTNRDVDYLDFRVLGSRSNYLVVDWDTPVKNYKLSRNSSFPMNLPQVNVSDVPNSCYTTTVDSGDKILQESYFPDAATFYENATPKLLAFLDTTGTAAFNSYNKATTWKTGTVPSWKLASDGKRMKSNLVFAHVDYFFYNVTQQYPLPLGVSSTSTIFTADNYNSRSIPFSCKTGLGNQKSQIVQQGYYGNAYTNGSFFPPGLAPSEYNNAMFSLCGYNVIDYNNANSMTGGKVTQTHYVIPLTDNPEITNLDDVMYFVQDTGSNNDEYYYDPATLEGVPRFGTYNNLRLAWVYHTYFDISPAVESDDFSQYYMCNDRCFIRNSENHIIETCSE
jgi:hypothetical protein